MSKYKIGFFEEGVKNNKYVPVNPTLPKKDRSLHLKGWGGLTEERTQT